MNIADEARQACARAYRGPWQAVHAVPAYTHQGWSVMAGDIDICSCVDEADAHFIAAARTLVPALVADNERLLHMLECAMANKVPPGQEPSDAP